MTNTNEQNSQSQRVLYQALETANKLVGYVTKAFHAKSLGTSANHMFTDSALQPIQTSLQALKTMQDQFTKTAQQDGIKFSPTVTGKNG